MSQPIKNRYEFMYLFECRNGNPNGDPDAGNAPRIDPQDLHGLVSDVAVKRRVRNYIQLSRGNAMPYSIFIQQSTNLNKEISRAHEEANGAIPETATIDKVERAKKWLCANFYDIRAFGGVLSTGANAGQVRGPIQFAFSRSIDPVIPLDISITRIATTEELKGNDKSSSAYERWELSQPEASLRGMGRKSLIPYGLFAGKGFISANLAKETGFSDKDLELFWEALLNMYEHDRSASKGEMSTIQPVIIFRHSGTDDGDANQREQQSKMGCAPAHKLFELVNIVKKQEVDIPRSYQDYILTLKSSLKPRGVDIGLAYIDEDGKLNVLWNDFSNLPMSIATINLE